MAATAAVAAAAAALASCCWIDVKRTDAVIGDSDAVVFSCWMEGPAIAAALLQLLLLHSDELDTAEGSNALRASLGVASRFEECDGLLSADCSTGSSFSWG